MKNSNKEPLFITQYPIVLYVWMALSMIIFFLLLIMTRPSVGNFLTWLLLVIILYYLLCRASCSILIYEDEFIVKKILGDNLIIKFEDIIKIDYKKGFFDFRAPIDNTYHFKLICFDTLFLSLKTNNLKININTRASGFDKLLSTILEKIQLFNE